MQKAALYARYSTDEQRATSLDDQLRRCKERAKSEGYVVPNALVFTDAAMTGSEKGLGRREGYRALLQAIEAGQCQAVIVTELSRLARDMSETLNFKKLIRRTGVRLLTIADGIDSNRKGWSLIIGFSGVMAEHVVEETRERVIAGMLGQLERGYQIAQAPFGYLAVKEVDARGEHIGTHWKIDEHKAIIVREMYAMRLKAMSYARIARVLNDRGILPPGHQRKKCAQFYWRPATVRQLLANPIFAGTFVWNGSGFTRSKAKKENRKVEIKEFPRKELAIVEHNTWVQCNPGVAPRPIRAGRTHPLSGLVRCGDCGARLSLSSGGKNSLNLHCSQCDSAKRVGGREDWMGYVAMCGLQAALQFVLARICNGAVRKELNTRLRAKLIGDNTAEVNSLKGQVARLTRACERLARQLREIDADDEILEAEYRTARTERRSLESRLDAAVKSMGRANKEVICAQIDVDPMPLLRELMNPGEHADRTQATLGRLFPKVALVKRLGRGVATFEFHVVPGVALAEASMTENVDGKVIVMRVQVTHDYAQPGQWTAAIEHKK